MKRLALLVLIVVVLSLPVAAQNTFELPITADVVYTVRPADTVDGIGAAFDISPTCIAEQNTLKNNVILIGQRLNLSVSCPRYGQDARDSGRRTVVIPRTVVTFVDSECEEGYRVRVNDSLDGIAFANNISTVSLAITNGLDPKGRLTVNQCLTIPSGDDVPPHGQYPALTMAGVTDETAGQGGGLAIPDGAKIHVVQPRQSVAFLAMFYNLDVTCLAQANALTHPSRLRAGDVLIIDETCPPYNPTLSGILPTPR